MTLKRICFFLFSAFTLISCNNSYEIKIPDSEPREKVWLLTLNDQIVRMDSLNTKRELMIETGNGDYKITYPKQVERPVGSRYEYIDYSENIIKATIENDEKIVFERVLLNDDEITAFFLLTDKKGEKTLLAAYPNNRTVEKDFFWSLEKKLINNPGYWQE